MNPNLDKLQPYPFERIRTLLDGLSPPASLKAISFAMGEPKHAPPEFVLDALRTHLDKVSVYPATKGIEALRAGIGQWLCRRFALQGASIDPDRHILPVNGTREALFAFAQAVIDNSKNPLVISPNPFYQIYEGATLLAGAQPYYLNTLAENGFLPDFDSVPAAIWQRCQLVYLCSPGNPTGAVLPLATLQKLINLADEYDFIIASDECYSEIYPDESSPPPGLLQACAALERHNFERCVVFHSLSKRSNLPGLRSGFVAGDAAVLEKFLVYRTYHGCAMSVPVQYASIAAWDDEEHVRENRRLYQEKFAAVIDILTPAMDVQAPDASFYLWAKTPIVDDIFTRELFANSHLQVVPGSYLGRDTDRGNPGASRIRMALVATPEECIEGAWRLRHFIESRS
ncbi:MAG: succinyldiaminopimelate transaminase [Porticoccaceae bacterium]|nr:succinyldiaminopimelate transaminase [Porticoccaceae bacterium]